MSRELDTQLLSEATHDEHARNELASIVRREFYPVASELIGPNIRAQGIFTSDLVQEITDEADKEVRKPGFQNRGSTAFRALVHRLARNLAASKGRRKHFARVVSNFDALIFGAIDPTMRADEAAEQADMYAKFQKFLDEQDTRLCQAYYLRVLEELTLDEAGKILGVSGQTVSNWVRKLVELAKERFPDLDIRGA